MSYLGKRHLFVFKDGVKSSGRIVSYGVPQGSIMDPILFSIYNKDMPRILDNNTDD